MINTGGPNVSIKVGPNQVVKRIREIVSAGAILTPEMSGRTDLGLARAFSVK